MRKTSRFIYFTFILFLPLAAGCGKTVIEPESGIIEGNEPISFSGASMVSMESDETKASRLDGTTFSDFGFYAALAGNSHFGPDTPGAGYMQNTKVVKDWTAGTWATELPCYWPLMKYGTVSFFLYAPYINDPAVLSLSPAPATGEPVLLYTPATSAQQQKDLCIAPALYDKTADDNPLSVHFDHSLTYIQFWANYKTGASGLPSGTFIKIDRVTLHNVIGTKGVTWRRTEPYFVWAEDSEDAIITDYSLSRAGEELTDNQVPSEPDTLHLEYSRGMLYLLPQTINEPEQSVKSTLEIDFSFYRLDGSTEVLISSFNVVKELPSGTVWAPCSVVRYFFTLNVENLSEVEISTSTTAWIDDWKSSDNQDPELIIEK